LGNKFFDLRHNFDGESSKVRKQDDDDDDDGDNNNNNNMRI